MQWTYFRFIFLKTKSIVYRWIKKRWSSLWKVLIVSYITKVNFIFIFVVGIFRLIKVILNGIFIYFATIVSFVCVCLPSFFYTFYVYKYNERNNHIPYVLQSLYTLSNKKVKIIIWLCAARMSERMHGNNFR